MTEKAGVVMGLISHPTQTRVVSKRKILFVMTLLLCFSLNVFGAQRTALDEYVARRDPTYAWEITKEEKAPDGFTIVEVHVTSQTWQETIWKNRLFIVVPPKVNSAKTTLMYISASGSGRDEIMAVKELTEALRVPMAVLMDIPNQPLFEGLREDALIAYTFKRYLETNDSDWPTLLPMVKGAVRAMDAFQEVVSEKYGWDTRHFVLAGASKRGWTTWLTGAVDERVIGIAPAVYNNLNLQEQMKLQARTFPGGASPKIRDYSDLNLHEILLTDQGRALSAIVDPYAYVDRLTMPKMLLHGTNDPYWPVDAANVYIDELPGQTYLVNFPNGGHDLGDMSRLLTSLGIFFMHVTELPILPEIKWSVVENDSDRHKDQGDGATGPVKSMKLIVERPPFAQDASVWVALSRSRDFTNATWTQVSAHSDGQDWFFEPTPVRGMYIAFYIEVKVGFSPSDTLRLDTPIFVIEP